MQRNHLLKKGYKQFLVKTKLGQLGKKNSEFFFKFNFFHVIFLIKVLNIISSNQNRNIHIFFKKKNPKVKLHLSKTFF